MAENDGRRDLDLEEDLAFQRRDWQFERAGWIVLLAAIGAGLAGLFGGGPLSRVERSSPDGSLVVEFERLARWEAPEELSIRVGSAHLTGGRALVWVSRDLLATHDVEDVTPPPRTVEARGDRYVYEIAARGPGPVTITLHLRPERWGHLPGAVGVDGGPEIPLGQIVFP